MIDVTSWTNIPFFRYDKAATETLTDPTLAIFRRLIIFDTYL